MRGDEKGEKTRPLWRVKDDKKGGRFLSFLGGCEEPIEDTK